MWTHLLVSLGLGIFIGVQREFLTTYQSLVKTTPSFYWAYHCLLAFLVLYYFYKGRKWSNKKNVAIALQFAISNSLVMILPMLLLSRIKLERAPFAVWERLLFPEEILLLCFLNLFFFAVTLVLTEQ